MNNKTVIALISMMIGVLIVLVFCFFFSEDKPDTVFCMESQPEQADGLLFDPVTGHVYKCFEREDGNYQLWLYPDGNLQVVYYIEKDGEKE
ncbi:MAG: hypothetical protein IKM24_02520 [Clostridia bacterium]|nr:hypothetical protein [Clostridia bacterium]